MENIDTQEKMRKFVREEVVEFQNVSFEAIRKILAKYTDAGYALEDLCVETFSPEVREEKDGFVFERRFKIMPKKGMTITGR